MNGWCFATAPCFGCGLPFSFNPHKVPSVRHEGIRKPVCRVCVELANPERVKNGLEPIAILPGSYDPMREEEL